MKHTFLLTVVAILFFLPLKLACAEKHHDGEMPKSIKVSTHKISEQIYMFQGKGGNVALLTGKDGGFLIDNDYTELTPAILEAVEKISDNKIRFVINTHWHGDHTGGNEILGKKGALIVAHHNVRKRLSEENYIAAFDMKSEPASEVALPALTYEESTAFYMNGETIRVFHNGNAHTDGDSIVYMPKANVVHMGDTYFNGFYPFIDASTGGTLDGMISTVNLALDLIKDDTVVIPGHGPISNKSQLQAYHDMLVGVREVLKPMIAEGKTVEQISESNPLAPFNEEWGDGFLSSDKWLGIVYDTMK